MGEQFCIFANSICEFHLLSILTKTWYGQFFKSLFQLF